MKTAEGIYNQLDNCTPGDIPYMQTVALLKIAEQLERLNNNLERVITENNQIQVSAVTATWLELNGL